MSNTCDPSYYDQSYREWLIRSEQLRRRGNIRVAAGAVIAVGGVILGTSDNDAVRAAGAIAQIGGVVLAQMGLVDLNRSAFSLPHMRPLCGSHFVHERRTVVVDRQQCFSTRYTERSWGHTRHYYVVECHRSRYVTYDTFDPWYRGQVVYY
jgi:hypothetical protein